MRDHRQARYPVSSVPVNNTPALRSRMLVRPDRFQFARQQVGQATRHRGDERMLGRTQARSIQVVLSSVYLSNACSDLSRPKPDCL